MWENNLHRKGLSNVYVVFRIKGLNLDRFINIVKKRGIVLYNIKKEQNNQLIVTVSHKDSKNFFAIAKEMCYNIKKVKYKGKSYPLLALLRAVPYVLGASVFAFIVICANDVVMSINFFGSGSVYKRQVQNYLTQKGIVPYVRFSSIDIEKLEDEVLAEHPQLSFVSIQKHGTRLNFNLVLSQEKVHKLDGNVYELTAPYDCVIEKMQIYRGTAQVKVGDQVKKGQLLVDGYAVIKEQKVKINVLAFLTVRVQAEYQYASKKYNDEQTAIAFTLSQLIDKQVVSYEVKKLKVGNLYNYIVTAYYRQVIYAG